MHNGLRACARCIIHKRGLAGTGRARVVLHIMGCVRARVVLSISGDRPCTVRIRNFFDAKFVRQKPSLLIAYGTLSDDSRIIVLLEVTGLWLEY